MKQYISDNYNRGTHALEKGNFEKALQFLKKETYECKELYLNLGTAYNGLNNIQKAKECFLKANDKFMPYMYEDVLGKEYPAALGNLGLIAYIEGDDVLSKEYCHRSLALDPLFKMSIWNYSLAMLREYCSGLPLHKWAWKMYDYRFKTVARNPMDQIMHWDGVSKVEKLVIMTEQGYGDKLMFARYIDRCKAYCSELVVQCTADMKGLYSSWETCDMIPLDSSCGIPLCSLARIFGDEDNAEWLRGKYVGTHGNKLRVAIEWAGNKQHKNDANRSCPVGYFSKLLKRFPSIEFVNIRPDSPKIKGITKVKVKDWEDSAIAIAGCDLVISVDTSLIHLAGSMGVPCLLMQPLRNTDFRWGNWKTKLSTGMDVESNIWYPSVKVIENPGWEKLMDELVVRLSIIESEYNVRKMLGGYTIEEFVEKVKNDKCED